MGFSEDLHGPCVEEGLISFPGGRLDVVGLSKPCARVGLWRVGRMETRATIGSSISLRGRSPVIANGGKCKAYHVCKNKHLT